MNNFRQDTPPSPSTPRSSEATVTLNFRPEDLSPPVFSQTVYQGDKITAKDKTLTVSNVGMAMIY